MRILQVIPSVATAYGGPSIAAIAAHRALLAKGVVARLLSADYASDRGQVLGKTEYDDLAQTPGVILLPARRPYRLKNASGLTARLIKEVACADLVVVHGQYLLLSILAPLLCRVMRKRYIIQPHGTLENYEKHRGSRFKGLYNGTIGKFAIGGASRVLVASASEIENAYTFIADKAFVVPFGAALDNPRPLPELQSRVESRDRRRCYLFLGRLASVKRPDVVIDAWGQGPRQAGDLLIVAGPDWDYSSVSLRQRAAALGVVDSVLFVGEVGPEVKSWLFHRCGVFVSPSENENFGMTIGEALAAGCIVITTRAVASSFHVSACGAGLVLDRPDSRQLAEAIQEVDSWSDMHILQLRESARSYAEAHLNWSGYADELIRVAVEGD